MSEINAESTTMPPVELRMPRASEREEMLAGKLYNSVDPELNALREKAGDLCARFNAASRTDHAARAAILDELLPGHGAGLDVMGPIFSTMAATSPSESACSPTSTSLCWIVAR